MLHANTLRYTWSIPEFEYREKNKNWYWLVGLVGLALIIVSVIMRNYLLGFFILIGVFLMFTQATRRPRLLDVEVSDAGIKIHDDLHKYETIQAFSIKERKNGDTILILLTSQPMTPLETLPLPDDADPFELRDFLLQYIPEENLRESYTERIINMIGF